MTAGYVRGQEIASSRNSHIFMQLRKTGFQGSEGFIRRETVTPLLKGRWKNAYSVANVSEYAMRFRALVRSILLIGDFAQRYVLLMIKTLTVNSVVSVLLCALLVPLLERCGLRREGRT